MLLLLLVVQLLGCLLLCYLLLCSLKLLINGLKHALFPVSFLLLLFFRIHFKQLIRNIEKFPQVSVFGLELLNIELVCLDDGLSNVSVVFYQGYFGFVNFFPIELYFTLQLFVVLDLLIKFYFKLFQIYYFHLLLVIDLFVVFKLINEPLYYSLIRSLFHDHCINLSSVFKFHVVNELLQVFN